MKTLRVELHSSWGGGDRVGLTEIQLLDSAGCVLPLCQDDVITKNAKSPSGAPSILFNGEEGTRVEQYMWSCERAQAGHPVEIHVSPRHTETAVAAVRIYNWNKPHDLDVCAKEVHLYKDSSSTPFYCGNLKAGEPTLITLPAADTSRGCLALYKRAKQLLIGGFVRYGKLVGRRPLLFIVLPILVFGALGAGLVTLQVEKDTETLYFPEDSRALHDRATVKRLFKVSRSTDLSEVWLLFRARNGDVFDNATLQEIRETVASVVSDQGQRVCRSQAEQLLTDRFRAALRLGRVTYPYWPRGDHGLALHDVISGVSTAEDGVLRAAEVIRFPFNCTRVWRFDFLSRARGLDPVHSEVTYATWMSLAEELDENTAGDAWMFGLTVLIMILYSCVVTSGGDPVSTRAFLSLGGVVAAALGIVGSFGLMSLCGVKFVNILGTLPFLVIGIGVDDMFLLMSSWSETLWQRQLTVAARVGATLGRAGVGVSITSITDFFAFLIGTTSVFRSVTNFCAYAGVAVFICYLSHLTLFSGCLAYHGRRVNASRHFLTCAKTRPRDQLRAEGRSCCFELCCGGSVPANSRADESVFEKLPRMVLPWVVFGRAARVCIMAGFLVYLAVAVFGLAHLKQGLDVRDLIRPSSYLYRHLVLTNRYFPERLTVEIVVADTLDYASDAGDELLRLLREAQADRDVVAPGHCWLSAYRHSRFFHINASASPRVFRRNLKSFLAANDRFRSDVVFEEEEKESQGEIVASRCMVRTRGIREMYEKADLMQRMRRIADDSALPAFAFNNNFVMYEQFLLILPATLWMLGCSVVVMILVTLLFLPHVLLVSLVALTIVMILAGVMGFMYILDLSLSSITMIELIMSVGFSVDYSAHVCSAYFISSGGSREARVRDAIEHASGPILNGALSTLLGVSMLGLSESFIFVSFFRIMALMTALGTLHAVLFLPVLLSLVGPHHHSPHCCSCPRHGSCSCSCPNVTCPAGASLSDVVLENVGCGDQPGANQYVPTETQRKPARESPLSTS